MKNEKKLFKQEDIAIACPQKMVWDEMKVVGEGRRICDDCDKVLVDVTGYTHDEVEALQKKDPSVCVAVSKALILSSLSFSLAVAGGDIENNEKNNSMVLIPIKSEISVIRIVDSIPIVLYEAEIPMVGMPPIPKCDEGTANLNAIKRFFGFKIDTSCREEE